MKLQLIFGALLLGALSARAETIPSPDRQFTVTTGDQIEVTDATVPVLTLVRSTTGVKRIEGAWSPDSRRVVVVEGYARGSGVFGAWHNGSTWHKTLEDDDGEAGAEFTRAVERPYG